MTRPQLLTRLVRGAATRTIGSKAANLLQLLVMGQRIPATQAISWDAYARYRAGDAELEQELRESLGRIAIPGKRFAVRSSADVEDSFERSFAGQFLSRLDVEGVDALVAAVRAVWDSAGSSQVQAYSRQRAERRESGAAPPVEPQMAVIVQDMINPLVSGVAFSRNPVTGIRETVIEAVLGPGTTLLQEGTTPFRWVFRHGEFTTRPDPDSTDIGLDLIEQVLRATRAIAGRMKADLDLEWVWDGRQLYWLQMRRITTLRDVRLYSNRISREMLAGVIKPLIWSVNIPLVNGAWISMLTELVGPNKLQPHELAKAFHYRAYFNMGLIGEVFEELGFPAESLEIMWGLAPKGTGTRSFRMGREGMRLLPRMLRFAVTKWQMLPTLSQRLLELERGIRSVDITGLWAQSPAELFMGIDRLHDSLRPVAHLNVVVPLSAIFYNFLLRRQLQRAGADFACLDMGQDRPEIKRFDPTPKLRRLGRELDNLAPDLLAQIEAGNGLAVAQMSQAPGITTAMADVLSDFGHLSDNGNDFSSIPWREDQGVVLRLAMIRDEAGRSQVNRVGLSELAFSGLGGWWTRILYGRATSFNLFREHISYIYALGYGLFRPYYLALAAHFVRLGYIDELDDIFYLAAPEIRAGALRLDGVACWRSIVSTRRAEIERARDIVLPELIYGDETPPPEVRSIRRLSGTATSRGCCQGPVRTIAGTADFAKVRPGDVLVIPHSDVSWTTLFGRAAGIVAESGGMLSHSSIVAREYGIPAVVSVFGAMQLKDDTIVRVDGFKGEVLVVAEDEDDLHGEET